MSLPNFQKGWIRTKNGKSKDVLAIDEELAVPQKVSSTEVIVKVRACSINPIDWMMMSTFPMSLFIKKPATPLMDFSGTIVKKGASVDRLSEEQDVFGKIPLSLDLKGFGSLCEYIKLETDTIVPMPTDKLKFEEAAAIPLAGATALGMSELGQLKEGDRVFVNGGSGGVGSFAIQIAKAYGAYVETSCSDRNMDLCYKLGADVVHNYREVNIVSKFSQEYQDKPFDLIFNCTTDNNGLYKNCHKYLKPQGHFIDIVLTGLKCFAQIMMRKYRPAILGGGHRKYSFFTLEDKLEPYEQLVKLIDEEKLKPVIDTVFDFDDALKAFARSEEGHATGKVVIKIS